MRCIICRRTDSVRIKLSKRFVMMLTYRKFVGRFLTSIVDCLFKGCSAAKGEVFRDTKENSINLVSSCYSIPGCWKCEDTSICVIKRIFKFKFGVGSVLFSDQTVHSMFVMFLKVIGYEKKK